MPRLSASIRGVSEELDRLVKPGGLGRCTGSRAASEELCVVESVADPDEPGYNDLVEPNTPLVIDLTTHLHVHQDPPIPETSSDGASFQ